MTGRIVQKSISVILVFTFSFSNILYAADVRQMLLDAKAAFEFEDQRRGGSGQTADQLAKSLAYSESVVGQLNDIADLEKMNFSLTTQNGDVLRYVGDKLGSVVRPDGTLLQNITLGQDGSIQSADLRLSDGSIQVFENGQIIGYRTPEGTQVFYENGLIQKTISREGIETLYSYGRDESGNIIETVLENSTSTTIYGANGNLKEVIQKADGRHIQYTDGILCSITNPDNSKILFQSEILNGQTKVIFKSYTDAFGVVYQTENQYLLPDGSTLKDIVWGEQGQVLSAVLESIDGNVYTFTQGLVSSVVLSDGSSIQNISWDANNKVNSATLTGPDGWQYVYENKQLIRSIDPQGIVVVYSYPQGKIIAVTGGITYEYLSDKTPTKITWVDGSYSQFNLAGIYKGLRDKDYSSQGVITSVYEYQTDLSGAIITQKRDVLPTLYNTTTLQGTSLSASTNPAFKFTALFAPDGSVDQSVQAQAVAGSKSLKLNLVAGSSSTWTFGGVVKPLGITLKKGTLYNVEFAWQSTKAVIYVYQALTAKPATAAVTITDRNWNPTFSSIATNAVVTLDATSTSRANYTQKIAINDKYSAYQPLSPSQKINFRFNTSSSGNAVSFTANQTKSGNITRTLTFAYLSGKWTLTRSDLDSKTNRTTKTTSAVNQSLAYGKDYVAELRIEGTKANLYVYDKVSQRPLTPTVSIVAFAVATKLSGALTNATVDAQILKNLSSPALSAVSSKPLSIAMNRLDELTVTRKTPNITRMNSSFLDQSVSFDWLLYNNDAGLAQIRQKDGSTLHFERGLLKEARDSKGDLTSFDFSQSSFGNLLGASLTQNGLTSHYDEAGNLSSVKINDTTIFYQKENQAIDFIQKDDGTEIHDIVFDENGTIKNSTIITSDGDQRYYEDGHLKKVIRGDQSELDFAYDTESLKDTLSRLVTSAKIIYNFDYTPDAINAVLDPSIVPSTEDITNMQYDHDFNLKKIVRQNQQIIEYSQNQKIDKIIEPSQSPKVFGYFQDGSYTVTQDNIQSFYDANNNQFKTMIYPDAQNANKLEVVYQYAKIRQIKKNDALTFEYTYSFGPDNKEVTYIRDLQEKTVKTYQDSILLTSLDENTTVLSSYSYTKDKVTNVSVTRLGRTLHTYQYTYDGDNTVVLDEEGVKRTYNQSQQLAFLEKQNSKYAYTYSADAQGNQIAQETLVGKTLSDGSAIYYDTAKSSNIQKIQKADGSVITDIQLNSDNTLKQATITLPDGSKKVFSQSFVLEEIQPDGTHFYYENGKLSKVTTSSGKDLIYSYDKNASGNTTQVWIQAANADLKYDVSGDLLGLKLDGMLTPEEVLLATQHTYLGGTPGLSFDGNFSTWQYASGRHNSGGIGIVSSAHTFSQDQTITSLTFSMYAYAIAAGSYTQDYEAYYDVQIYRDNQWQIVPGTFGGTYKRQGGGSYTANSGIVTLSNLNLSGVSAVKAAAHGFSNSSGNSGASSAAAAIYEIQYLLADQANLFFSTNKNANNQITGYTFQGYPGTLSFDSQGNLLPGTPGNLASIGQFLNGSMSFLCDKPYFSKIEAPLLQNTWVSTSKESILDSSAVLCQEYASSTGELETQTKADHTVTLFENNKPSIVTNQAGQILIEYSYDADGNIQSVNLKNARETLPKEVLEARQSIESQRAASLKTLADQKNLTTQTIEGQISPQRQALLSQLNNLHNQFNDVSGTKASGKKAKSQKGDALNQIGQAMDQTRNALAELDSQASSAYAALDGQVKTLSDQIEADAQNALAGLAVQQANLQKEILKQEVSPIVYDFYRRILGRDPSSLEYDYWIGGISYSVPGKTTDGVDLTLSLNNYLNALPELKDRQAYVQNIKNKITTGINAYLSKSDSQKISYAASLGLGSEELIVLSASDAQKILNWLESRSLHFGQSAFLSLEAMLDQKGISYAREDIAEKAILIDILTGVISPLDDGDLVISMFALNKVAESYGLALSGANLSFEDLQALYAQRTTQDAPRIIAHINGNHYVVITGITQDSITYIDPGIGADKQNETLTVAKDGFMKVWKGNVTLESSKLQALAGYQNKTLSAIQTQQIRGAFFGSILGLIGSILTWVPGLNGIGIALTAISAAVSAIEGDFISAISSIVTLGMGNLGSFFQSAFDGVIKAMGPIGQMFSAVGQVFGSIYTGVVGFLNSAIGFLPGIGPALQGMAGALHTTIGAQIVNTALSTGLSMAATKGLETLGLNPQIAGFLGNLTAGAVIGALQGNTTSAGNAVTQAQNIQSSIQQVVTIDQVGRLGLELGLDSQFTNIVGLSMAAIQGQIIDGSASNIAEAFSNIKPELFSSLGQYGLGDLGKSLGFSPELARMIGSPISAAINIGFQKGQDFGKELIRGIQDGMFAGVVGYGMTFATDQIAPGSPLAMALLSRTFTGLLDGVLNPNISMFQGAFNALSKSIGNLAESLTTTDFNQVVQQKGLLGALKENATSVFSRDALEQIIQQGGIAQILNGNARFTEIKFSDGNPIPVKEVNVGTTTLYYSAYNDQNLYGRKIGNRFERGYFGTDSAGGFALRSGEVEIDLGNGLVMEVAVDGYQAKGYELKSNGTPLLLSYALNGQYQAGPNLTIENGVIESKTTGVKVTFKDGKAQEIFIPGPSEENLPIKKPLSELSQEGLLNLVNYITLSNGINNSRPEGELPFSMEGLAWAIEQSGGDASRIIMPIPVYEESPGIGWDGATWIRDVLFGTNEITNEMLDKIYQHFAANPDLQTRGATMVLYSGSGNPGVKANDISNLNVKSIVLIGAPMLKFNIENPNTQTIVQFVGEEDVLKLTTGVKFYADKLATTLVPNQFKIKIQGMGHTDYMVDLDPTRNPNPDPVKVRINREVAEVIKLANNYQVLETYLKTSNWYSKDPVTGYYTLDPKKIPEDNKR